jgi:hypothetical protein
MSRRTEGNYENHNKNIDTRAAVLLNMKQECQPLRHDVQLTRFASHGWRTEPFPF